MFQLLRKSLSIIVLSLPLPACAATCGGTDLLATLTPEDRATLDQAVAAAPYASGNHWRAEKDGRSIDLIGTYHIFDPRMTDIAARLQPVIEGADRVYLEATDRETAQLKSTLLIHPDMLYTTGPTLADRLPTEDWRALSAALSERGIPAIMAAKLQPWYVSVLLGLPRCAMPESGRSEGLDALIGQIAGKDKVPLKALEPYDSLFKAFDRIPPDTQLSMIREGLPSVTEAEDMLATMAGSYFRQDHRQIWEFERLNAMRAAGTRAPRVAQDFSTLEQALVIDRNRAWIPVMTDPTNPPKLVVAVGVGHLSGEQGLLNLLAQDGWRLTRQEF